MTFKTSHLLHAFSNAIFLSCTTVDKISLTQCRAVPLQLPGLLVISYKPIITVARDRDSDSERLLYFSRVIYFLKFCFRPPNFRRPSADFHETLAHDAVCAEIVYLL